MRKTHQIVYEFIKMNISTNVDGIKIILRILDPKYCNNHKNVHEHVSNFKNKYESIEITHGVWDAKINLCSHQ